MSTEKGGDVIVWKESPFPIKRGTHSYEMPTARLSSQAWDDPLITSYMVMGLVSRDRGRRTSHSVVCTGLGRERERKKGGGWEEGAERERKGVWWEGGT